MILRCRHNFRKYTLSDRGVVRESPIIGNAVLIERGLDDAYFPFGGFMHINSTSEMQSYPLAKILNIEAFTFDEFGLTDWIDLPITQGVVGLKKDAKYYVPILNGSPVLY